MTAPLYVAPGELRTDLFSLFDNDDSVHVLLAQPGLLPAPSLGQAAIARFPASRPSIEHAYAFRHAVFGFLNRELDNLPQSEEWRLRILKWIDRTRNRTALFRHAMGRPIFTRIVSRLAETVVVQGPITCATANSEPGRELNLHLTGAEHASARSWFEGNFDQAADVTDEVNAALQNSWAGELLTPDDLYHKLLAEYFRATLETMDRDLDRNPLLEVMTNFQADAYHYAKGILRRFGGVLVADVVGLGKTFIGMALLRHLQDRYDQHAVVVAPPAVCPAWQALAAEHRVTLVTVSHGKLEDLDKYTDRDVLLLDESHNFRHDDTARFDRLSKWLRPGGAPAHRRVILVSATPQNNHARDVHNQLLLFPDNHMRLPFPGESLDAFFRAVSRGEASLASLLQHVVVRRTRRFIKESYPDARLRVRKPDGRYESTPLVFPDRISGADQCLRYALDQTYGGGLYDRLVAAIATMSYTLYAPATRILGRHRDDPRVKGLSLAGRGLRGLMKVLLLKRLESSTFAILCTLNRLAQRHREALAHLERGQVRVRAAKSSRSTADDEESDCSDDGDTLPAAMFDAKAMRCDLEQDLATVVQLLAGISRLNERTDAKLIRLEAALKDRPPTSHRTLVFTQFADTAGYLSKALGQRFGRTAMVTGSSSDAMGTVRRFAPRGNRANGVRHEEEIDLLISTDALSEGVNLQDADTVINYDLHWNPVRLIQRAGRIDRIGSPNDTIVVASFLPERELEARLGLEAVLRRRIEEFLKVFGEDSHVLPSDEKLDATEVVSAYTGAALDESDKSDDMDGLGRHAERILLVRRTDPNRYDKLLQMRLARRAASSGAGPDIAATRLGWYWEFWRGRGSRVERIDDVEGLEACWRHAQAGPLSADESQARVNAFARLERLAKGARESFTPTARVLREQRAQPRLSAIEEWVRAQLERHRVVCNQARQGLVDDLLVWVRSGQQKQRVMRAARLWRQEGLTAESVFNEIRSLASSFPLQADAFEDEELVGLVAGKS